MEVFLHKICGQPVQPPVSMQLRRCTPEQAPAVYALQNEVLQKKSSETPVSELFLTYSSFSGTFP